MLARRRLFVACGCLAMGACAIAPRRSTPLPGPSPAPSQAELSLPSGAAALQSARLVIRTVDLTLQADSPSVLVPEITRITAEAGGYIEQGNSTEGKSAEFRLRIPALALDAAVARIERLAEVRERRDSGRDVTEETTDVEARIASLAVVRDRLRSLVDRAATIQDVLAVERELARVQGEIDSMQARLNLLRSSAALAQISLRVNRPVVLGPISWLFVGAGKLLEKLFVIR